MSNEINRRRFLADAARGIATAQFGLISSIKPAAPAVSKPATSASFGEVKQIVAGVLNVGYVEAGPASGPAVILLHGWPYDIHSYADVAPLLASKGCRVIVPYLRG